MEEKMEDAIFLTKKDIVDGFRSCGLNIGDPIIVHTSLGKLGFVCGGAQTVIEALLECVGAEGTVLMPSQSWKNLDPSTGVHGNIPVEWWPAIRENWPAYDKNITPTNTMGAVAEMFRQWPMAVRSDHPARSFAAFGKYSEYLISEHDRSNIFGLGSPLDRLYHLGGKVLLIGVGYDKNTSLHLADEKANYASKNYTKESSAVLINGQRAWITYDTLAVDGEDFEEIGSSFEEHHSIATIQLGNGVVKLMSQKELVDFAVSWIEQNRK